MLLGYKCSAGHQCYKSMYQDQTQRDAQKDMMARCMKPMSTAMSTISVDDVAAAATESSVGVPLRLAMRTHRLNPCGDTSTLRTLRH